MGLDYQDVFEDPDSIHLVMELCEGGGILERIKEQPFTEKQVANLSSALCAFCSTRGYLS